MDARIVEDQASVSTGDDVVSARNVEEVVSVSMAGSTVGAKSAEGAACMYRAAVRCQQFITTLTPLIESRGIEHKPCPKVIRCQICM
jgi:hypothetical protein